MGLEKDEMSVESKSFATAIVNLIYTFILPESEWNTDTIEQMFLFSTDFIKSVLKESSTKSEFKLSDLKYSTIVRDKRIVIVYDTCLVSGAIRMDAELEEEQPSKEVRLAKGEFIVI